MIDAIRLYIAQRRHDDARQIIGMDEISISEGTHIAELKGGEVSEYTVHPDDFGLPSAPLSMLRVANIDEACEKLLGVLNNEAGAPRDIVQLNAGAAKAKLDQLVASSNSFKA